MSTAVPPAQTGASQQAVIDTALLLLRQLGLSPADLAAVPHDRPPVPTFAEYIPAVAATVSAGTRRAYGTYWNRITEHWGPRRLDEPTPTEIRQLMAWVKANVVNRRNGADRSARLGPNLIQPAPVTLSPTWGPWAATALCLACVPTAAVGSGTDG